MKLSMHSTFFDSYQFIKRLISSDIPEKQAEAIIGVIHDIQSNNRLNFLTVDDKEHMLKVVLEEINQIRQEIQKMELRMTIKLGSILAFALSLVVAVLKVV